MADVLRVVISKLAKLFDQPKSGQQRNFSLFFEVKEMFFLL